MKVLPFLTTSNVLITIIICLSCQHRNSSSSAASSNYSGFEALPFSKTHVTNSNDLPETAQTNHLIWDSYYNGGGVAVGDVNNDGLTDLYFTNTMKPNSLYLNKGDFTFEDVTAAAGVDGGIGVSWGATMADINKDGWLDIYVSKSGASMDYESQRNRCYMNNKNGTFTDMAKEMGIDNPGHTVQSAFFDYDLDGDLDLFVMNQPSNARGERTKYKDDNEKEFTNETTSDRLFRNDGNMKFTDVSAQAGVVSFIYGLGLKICDLNGDQWPDIYVASDYNWADQLLINNHDGTFTDAVHSYFDHLSNFSMGMDIGDLNNDNLDDIFILDMAGANHFRSKTNMPSMSPTKFWKLVASGKHYQYMHNVLQMNRGNGVFSEVAYEAGVSKTDWSWGVLFM
ncbi:MAG: VCBS repeat-containing protein, partial [Flavobacterium sp.]